MIARPQLVIFDCDGVLVDSEPASRAVVFQEAAALDWALTEAEAAGFVGLRWSDLQPLFQRHSAVSLGPDWPDRMQARLITALDGHLRAMQGAADLLRAVAAMGLPYRIASNSSHEEMAVKFRLAGLAPLVEGRVHSAREVGRGKPAPDLFLAAASAGGVSPASCLVVEDSVPGVTAAMAAGMACIGYAPGGDLFGLADLGATIVRSLADIPALLGAARADAAMSGLLLALYPWTKAIHIMAVIAWMAGMFYLPRLYVYHCETAPGSEGSERFKVMERKLYKQIMTPALLATFVLGIMLALTPGLVNWHQGWFHVKLLAVLALGGFHGALGKWRREFLHDRRTKSQRFFRIANEVPTVLMAVAVIMVVVQPF